MQRTAVDGLDLIATGPEPPNPAELLTSPRLAAFLDEVRSLYDLVIIDSSPILAVTDPAIIGAAVDGVVLVVRPARLKVHDAERTRELLESLGTPVLGTVVNGVGRERGGYGTYGTYGAYGGPRPRCGPPRSPTPRRPSRRRRGRRRPRPRRCRAPRPTATPATTRSHLTRADRDQHGPGPNRTDPRRPTDAPPMPACLLPLLLLAATAPGGDARRRPAGRAPPQLIVVRRCDVEYERSSLVGPALAGGGATVLQDCLVRRGDRVEPGQVLGRVVDPSSAPSSSCRSPRPRPTSTSASARRGWRRR